MLNKIFVPTTVILSLAILFSVGTVYAAPDLIVDAQPNSQTLAVAWSEPSFSDTNILFYTVQVIEEKCRDGQTNCNEFEKIHYSATTYPPNAFAIVDVNYGKFYTVQVSTAAIQNGNYVISTDSGSRLTGQTIGDKPGPGHNDKPTASIIKLSTISYAGDVISISSGSSDGKGHTITDTEWIAKDKNGRVISSANNLVSFLVSITSSPQRDNYFTISYRVFNGLWSDPSIITIDWEPQKQDVIKQVKERIEKTKENRYYHSQKVWQRVLLSLDSSIPERSEYRYDPTGSWSDPLQPRTLTPFDLSNGRDIGGKHQAAADTALENGQLKKYENKKALAELWYNVWAHR